MRKEIIIESIIIGFIAIVLQFIIYRILMGEFPNSNDSGYKEMIIGQFFIGFLIHFGFEIVGVNEWRFKKIIQ
jgi:hypothetical protein